MLLALYSLCNAQSVTADNPRKLFHINNGWNGAPDTSTLTDADADAFITAAGITNTTQKNAITRLVLDLKGTRNDGYATANIWSKFTAIYPFVGGTSTTCKYNLKDPRNLDAAYRLTFGADATFSATGVSFDQSFANAYADTHITPSALWATDSSQGSLSIYAQSWDVAAGTRAFIGTRSTLQILQIGLSSNSNNLNVNHPSGISLSNNYVGGFYMFDKTARNSYAIYFNGVKGSIGTFATDFGTDPLMPSFFVGRGNGVAGITFVASFASLSNQGLTQYEATCFSNAVQQFQTTLNRQVF